jgi:hypothetical protein
MAICANLRPKNIVAQRCKAPHLSKQGRFPAVPAFKSMNQNSPNDPQLQKALQSWKISGRVPPRFQQEVWKRIASSESQPGGWFQFTDWLNAFLPRPAVALAYVLVLLFAGLSAGWWQAREETSRLEQNLSQRYVQAVDPYQKSRP